MRLFSLAFTLACALLFLSSGSAHTGQHGMTVDAPEPHGSLFGADRGNGKSAQAECGGLAAAARPHVARPAGPHDLLSPPAAAISPPPGAGNESAQRGTVSLAARDPPARRDTDTPSAPPGADTPRA